MKSVFDLAGWPRGISPCGITPRIHR